MSRWISSVRPPCLPVAASRRLRVCVARGSMPYSAVTQPRPVLRRNAGTPLRRWRCRARASRRHSISTEPSAWRVKRRVMRMGRSSSGARPLGRFHGTLFSGRAVARQFSGPIGLGKPAQDGGGGIIAERRRCLHGAAPERLQPGAQILRVVAEKAAISSSRKFAQMPSVHSSIISPGCSTCRPLMDISGMAGSPPRQHSTKLRMGWVATPLP